MAQKFLFQKYNGWAYEDEARVWVSRDMPDSDGKYYADFARNRLTLREVFLGHRCCEEAGSVVALVASLPQSVAIVKTRLSYTDFSVVEENRQWSKRL